MLSHDRTADNETETLAATQQLRQRLRPGNAASNELVVAAATTTATVTAVKATTKTLASTH